MNEYVRFLNGGTSATMANREYTKFVAITKSDTSPGEGWWPVEKVLPKPEKGEGEELAYSYTVRDGVAYKEYFTVPLGKSFLPRVFSKFALEGKLFEEGLMSAVDAIIDSQVITNSLGQTMPLRRRYETALVFREDHPDFSRVLGAIKESLGVTDEKVEEILAASVEEA